MSMRREHGTAQRRTRIRYGASCVSARRRPRTQSPALAVQHDGDREGTHACRRTAAARHRRVRDGEDCVQGGEVKVSWPSACRAQGSLTAYQTALDWMKRYPEDTVASLLVEKIDEKRSILADYNAQKEKRF